MALYSNFLLHLAFVIAFGARTQFLWWQGSVLDWKLYIYLKWEGKERVEEKYAIKQNKTLTINHLFKSSLNKGFKTQK